MDMTGRQVELEHTAVGPAGTGHLDDSRPGAATMAAPSVPTTLTLQPAQGESRTFDAGEPILMGEAAGRVARSVLGLDAIDGGAGPATLKVDPLVVTPSYIRGLVGPSVSHLGYEGFSRKYAIEATPSVRDTILFIAEYGDRQPKG